MRALHTKANVNAPGGSYPFGRVRNNPGDNSGTHVDEELVGDLMQFFEKLMDDGGVSPNGQPENSSSGFQLNAALAAVIANATNPKLNKSGGTMSGDIDMATHKIINLPASSANGEAVRHEEIVTEAAARDALDDSGIVWATTGITITSGWSGGGSLSVFGARKVRGIVQLRGYLEKSTAPSSGDTVFNLPVGMRPLQPTRFRVAAGTFTDTDLVMLIATNGDVTINGSFTPPDVGFHMDGITFDMAH